MANVLPTVSKDDSAAFTDAHRDFHASETEATANWEKRIEKAEKLEPEDWRDFEYFTIIFGYLLRKKDFTRAAAIVSRISNQELKEKSRDLVSLNALQAKLEKPETATSDALRLFDQAVAEANQIKDDQDRLQAKLLLIQLSLRLDSSIGFERATAVFKDINKFSDFNMNRSDLSLRVVVYGLKNELSINSPAPSSLLSAVSTMCRVNCEETLQLSRLLEKKETRLWATFVAVRTGLMESLRKSNAALR
jgi:hypothetical protein